MKNSPNHARTKNAIAALTLVALGGGAVEGCGDAFDQPAYPANVKAELRTALQPTAIKVAGLVIAESKKARDVITIPDPEDKTGTVLSLTRSSAPDGTGYSDDYELTVSLKKTKGKLDPASVYDVRLTDTTTNPSKHQVDDTTEISSREISPYTGNNWYAEDSIINGPFDGKTKPDDSFGGTALDDPKDPTQVHASLAVANADANALYDSARNVLAAPHAF